MRLWSLHPRYLDPKGLVALWREALLAQAVLAGRTRGYTHHPQLKRFLESPRPPQYIAAYLEAIHAEAARRGYRFDARKIGRRARIKRLSVTRGQLSYEWAHLKCKLRKRASSWLSASRGVKLPQPHPLFRVVEGDLAEWEVGARR
jgi:hypothetical protein